MRALLRLQHRPHHCLMPKGILLLWLCCRIHRLHPLLYLLPPLGWLAAAAALSPMPNSNQVEFPGQAK